MQKLAKKQIIRGTGIAGLTATQIERTDKKAIFQRNDGVFEVFKIKIVDAQSWQGKFFPEHEKYPSNEDFGKSAWNFRNKVRAMTFYRGLNVTVR